MRYGVCTTLKNIPHGITGLDYVESTISDTVCPLEGEEVFESRLEAVKGSPAPVEGLYILFPGDMKTTGPDVDNERLDRYMATVLARAGRLGAKIIGFGAGRSRQCPEGFDRLAAVDQIVGHLQRWGPPAANVGIVIALEPLHRPETNLVTNLTEGGDVVRRVNLPGVRLLADIYHMAKEGETPESLRQVADVIGHVHCAETNGRGAPGATGEDLRPYFRVLKEIGYSRRISIEAGWKDFAAQLPGAIEELRRQVESA
jgi:sugar phosphate isomerase/epimerase